MLRVRLLGTGQVSYRDQAVDGFPNQQCYLLLSYLLLNRHRPHHRERLAAVFWGDYPTASSRKHLRNVLWRLRSALQSVGVLVDDYLTVDEDSVSFRCSSQYWLDVEDFERAVARCQDLEGERLTAEQATCLEEAIAVYVGDLLEGVYEDWCLHDRERLRLLYLNTLSKLLAFHERHGAYECGLAYGNRILACDPIREKVHRQVMRLYWLLGERGEALTQYKCCVQILREELGIAPAERTRLLYQQMVSNQFDPDTWPVSRDTHTPERIPQELSNLPLLDHVLHKLQLLQAASEESSSELNQIVGLIKALTSTR
jgi:DNA-binding SARP family transcriptional activator